MQISVRRANSAKIPRGLDRCRLEPETSAMIQQEAIEVFTAMINGGRSFQHALQAVFLSGMNAARPDVARASAAEKKSTNQAV